MKGTSIQFKMLDFELQTVVVASAGWVHGVGPETLGVEKVRRSKKGVK